MLSVEENALLTDISPGTPMGNLMRRYWVPVMLSGELPEPDGDPCAYACCVRTWSSSATRSEGWPAAGTLPAPPRVALPGAQPRKGGLRCIYHGWKYDVTGRCVDMPNEPPESSFKEKIRPSGYPAGRRRHDLDVHGPTRRAAAAPPFRMDGRA